MKISFFLLPSSFFLLTAVSFTAISLERVAVNPVVVTQGNLRFMVPPCTDNQVVGVSGTRFVCKNVMTSVCQPADRPVGTGQAWVNVTNNRSLKTAFRNTTGCPIYVSGYANIYHTEFQVSSNGTDWVTTVPSVQINNAQRHFWNAIVPNGHFYRLESMTNDPNYRPHWAELR